MSKTSPTQRSLKLCRDRGWTAQVVERRVPFNNTTVDLFGFIDIVALDGTHTIGIQTTSGANVAARIKKILAEPRHKLWLEAGNEIHVHGWRKVKPRGVKVARWEVREEVVG